MPIRSTALLGTLALVATASLASAGHAQQQSESYKFLQAVRDTKGDEVTRMLDQPGSRIVNTRDVSSGEGALHIVIRRGDTTYLTYLLSRGANPDLADNHGETPLLLAVGTGDVAMVNALLDHHANVNLANNSGETPLIRAVQKRDLPMMHVLLAAGASPDQTDHLAGMSARDYARRDTRTPALARELDATPKKTRAAVSGPQL